MITIRSRFPGHEIVSQVSHRLPLAAYKPLLPRHPGGTGSFYDRAHAIACHTVAIQRLAWSDASGLTPSTNPGAIIGASANLFSHPIAFRDSAGEALLVDFPTLNPPVFAGADTDDLEPAGWRWLDVDSWLHPFDLGDEVTEFIIRVSAPFDSFAELEPVGEAITAAIQKAPEMRINVIR